ncbi:hypothetical protein [Leptolyngbya sp. NIES-2104]|uniref:hypothetical protein n=1 Tax=Leptolyngbya sp. NIES-2104 TaxID=1552121 RepID=UPI0006EC9394|nr:hypothetical protein [Leptolyngbya sp. NIES-2104]GAP97677.1 hypothetical protein NIES2104_42240 [Leptolyngbya sp. NIES-2104]
MMVTRSTVEFSARSLSRSWASRYLPDLSALMSEQADLSIAHLLECSSDFGRRRTVEQVQRHLRICCELAGLEVNQLFSGSSNLVNLAKVRQLAKSVEAVYEKVLQFYEQQSNIKQNLADSLNPVSGWVPEIEALSIELQPVLYQMQQQHLADEDPRAIGFVTTQFHFSTQMILKRLNPIEKALLGSYFQLAEEQVCTPWQEICELANRSDRASREVLLIEQLLSEGNAIAQAVCEKARQQFPQFKSRRGSWDNVQITTSMKRDLNMFQCYLWLCVLHQDLSPITVRLLPLCLMVFPSVNISWEFIDQTVRLLVEEVRSRLTQNQWSIVQPYAVGLIDTFSVQQ